MICRLSIFLLFLGVAVAQDVSIAAGADQTDPRQVLIQVTGMTSTQFEAFFGLARPGHKGSAYKLYVISHLDEPEMRADDQTSAYINPAQDVQVGFGEIKCPLLQPLLAVKDQSYLIVINGLGSKGRVISKIDPKGSIISTGPVRVANEVKITAPIPLSNQQDSMIEVDRKKATLKAGQFTPTPDKIPARIARIDADGLVLELRKRLPSGSNSLSVVGLKDAAGNLVSAQGKIDVNAAPTNEADAYVLAKVGANAAVHQAPVFTFTGSIAPLHPPSRATFLGPVRFDPSTTIDVGLRSTKSANSIIVPAAFTRAVIFGLPNPTEQVSLAQLQKVNPFAMQFAFGPRIETDRDFQRLNSLGEFRWEIYLPGLSKDSIGRKASVAVAHPDYRDFLELPTRGYTFTPYFQFDGGAHVNEETVANTKTKQSVVVPSHSIARAYFGLKGTIQFWLASIDLDTSYIDMLDQETIGYTTSTQALLRRIKGWQPHAKAAFSVYLNPAKHAAFTITCENGRTPPNFEYLNKVDVGFKVIY
jgi:hypothetical protein